MVDYRNKDKVAQFAQRRQLDKFAQANAEGRVVVADMLGRPLHVGDLVALDAPQARVFRLVDLRPMLEPNVPAGTMRAIFATEVTMGLGAGQVHGQILLLDPVEAQMPAGGGEPVEGIAPAAEGVEAPEEMPVSPTGPRRITLTDGN